MDKRGSSILLIIGVFLAIILVWGFIGGMEAQSPGVTCDMGVGEIFCWKWHKNLVGQAQEFLGDTGNAIKSLFE